MKKKTLEKLMRRFLVLPLHHINTDVVIEEGTTEDGRYCKKYLNIVGYKYRGVVPFPVLSELFFKIINLETFDEQWDMFNLVTSLIKNKKIGFYSPRNIADTDKRMAQLDKRIQPLDRQIVACAVENKATLVTIDTDLVNNIKIENEFRIKIKHPKDLI